MSDWKKSAKYIVDNSKTTPQTTQNTPAVTDNSQKWKSSAKNILNNVGFVSVEKSKRTEDKKTYDDSEKQTSSTAQTNTSQKKDGFFSWLGKQTMAGLGQFNKSFAATLDFILPTEFLGRYDYISKLNDYYSKQNENYSNSAYNSSVSRGKYWKTAGDIVAGSVAAAPNAILSYLSAGTTLGASGTGAIANATATTGSKLSALKQTVNTMVKNPSYWTSVIQTLGTDYEEAKERGANDLVASATAIITTALNAGIEVSGGIEQLPKNLKKGGKNVKNAVFEWAKSALEEGNEEILQSITTNAAAKLIYDKKAPIFSMTDDTAVINPIKLSKDFGMGAAVGGLLGGGQVAVAQSLNAAQYIKTGKYFKNANAVSEIIGTGLESPKDSVSYKLAKNAQEKTNNNKTLSDYEIGRLYYANVNQIETEEMTAKNNTQEPSKAENDFNIKDNKLKPTLKTANDNMTVNVNNNQNINTAEQKNPTISNNTESPVLNNSANTDLFRTTIPFFRNGDYYEVIGNDAVMLAEKFNLPLTTISDESSIQTVRFPVNNLESYRKALENEYEIKVVDNDTKSAEASNTNDSASENVNTADVQNAQSYNILVSNLKRKAQELGLLDNAFYENLQNVNLYSPSQSDKARINGEFNRIFSNNTDALVSSWLNAINENTQTKTSNIPQNAPVNDESISVNDNEIHDVTQTPKTMYDLMDELGLTYEEKRAILEYKSSGSYTLNEVLRSGENLNAEQKTLKNNINAALDKFPSYKGIVHREIGFNTQSEFEAFISAHKGKNIITYSAFTSASKYKGGYSVDKPYKVYYEIVSRSGKDVSSIGLTEESEILFKTETEIQIKSFNLEDNKIEILCEELMNSGTELQTPVNEAGNGKTDNGYVEQKNTLDSGNEYTQKVDSVREGSGDLYGISETQSAGSREKIDRDNISDSTELREVDRNDSGTPRVLERNGVDENTAVNEDATDAYVINHAKEVDGLKLIDTEKNTLINGKTLITGVYELNSAKDFGRKSYKKEKFDTLRIHATSEAHKPKIETVNGTTYGRYGFYKYKTNGYSNDGYSVEYLPVGILVAKANTESEAKTLIEALDDNFPKLPLSIKAFGDEYRYYGITQELGAKVKNFTDSVIGNASKISLPLKNKKELVSYLENNKGKKIGVSYNGGEEDIRTIVSASDTAIVTEREDGQKGTLSAKSNELSYTDDGFVYTGSNGATVSYRFINEDVSSEKTTDALPSASDNGISQNSEIVNTPENVKKGGMKNGADESGKNYKDSDGYSEIQTEEYAEAVDNRRDKGRIGDSEQAEPDRGRSKGIENRALEVLIEDEKFNNLAKFVGNEINRDIQKKIFENYNNDTRLDDGYEFSEIVAYDMLSDESNNLREMFSDNIAEYFNKYIDVMADITGKKIPKDILKTTKNTVVKNNKGQLIPVYHSTASSFKHFTRGDVGYHFGSLPQAVKRAKDKGIKAPKYIKAYLNIESPLYVDEDFFGWNASQIAQKLNKMGVINSDESVSLVSGTATEGNIRLKELLKQKGYDGIIYKNELEALNGTSYIVFDDNQIFRLSDTAEQVSNKNNEIKEKTKKENTENVYNGLLDGESGNDNEIRKSEPVSEASEKRNAGATDRELGENVASKNGERIQASEAETFAAGQHGGGDSDNGVRKSDDGNGNGGTGTDGNDNVHVTKNDKTKDFSITKTVAEDIDKSAPSMADNIKAIETLYDIEKSGKAPTKTHQSLLAKFKGWGGLAGSFYGENREKLQKLMSENELKAAQSTVNDAYFTPTSIIDGIYKGISHLGFEGGNILEPSMGIGNFFGRMPKAVKDNSSLFGVEIDSVSGRIAQQLYPSADIEISPFQDTSYKDGAFDLIIGNVPFGEVKYNYKGKKYLIHDYFFVKAMDKLNDGGILAFLTTKGTLDKLDSTTRNELNNKGNLLGAYRLPSDVFTKSAGANVVTDLIIMQKSSDTNSEKFVNLGTVTEANKEFSINEYFQNHPENIIGNLTTRRDWRSGKTVLDVTSSGNTAEQLIKAMKKLPKNLLNGVQTVGNVDVVENTAPVQTFEVTENGNVEYIDAVTGEVKQIKGKNAKTAKDYVELKKTYGELIDATLNNYETNYIESKRKALNTAYDSFVKKYGTLEKNKKVLACDNDFYKISGLEVYDTKTKKIVKSEMFKKDTLGKKQPKKADSVLDALSISIGETGGVNINRIAELTGISESEAVNRLDDRIVYTPDGIYELNEVYLSGNVREKYEAVKDKKGFEKNARMLKAVIPEDIPAKNIAPQFGSPWIKPKYVADFLKETLHLYSTPAVNYDSITGTWSISGNAWGDNTLMTNKYGTKYMDAVKIAEKALNMRRIVVTDRETKKMLVGETRAAQQKAEDIKSAFEEWCFKDSERRKDLVETFNKKFNSNRNMDFSELSKYLTFDGLTDTFKLRDYQKRAVARAVFNGNTLLAHGVGTGKTAEMISIAMELKRMGIAKKNMMVVPNHKAADFRNDILKMYPSAKVAYLEKGASSVQRQKFYALVASNDFDIAIIPHSAFGMLDVSADTKRAFINNQISELEEVMTAAQAEKGKIDGRFISALENQKKRLEEKLKFVTESAKDSGNVFEELGVDSLFVDEAHNFKNLPFYSKLSRVAGVSINQSNNKTRASRAENMFMITDYLNRNGGRITFGTATPITNSMSEIYNMIRFLRPDILADAGLQSFDAWASMFGSIVNQAEVDPSGRNMRMKERFSKFKNVSQMIEQFRRMADILKTGDVIQDLPKAERIDVYNETNAYQEEFLDIIDRMIEDIRAKGQNAEHNMLEVTKAGQMAAIDLRFVASYFDGKYTIQDLNLPNNRTSQVAQRVYKEYTDSNPTKGTQFIFCDYGVRDNPDSKYNFYVYGDLINKLTELGIPRNEIAIAQDFSDKAELSAKVNTGEIRVLIGSTAVMGEGMNAQNKAVALHHMTVPDRPSDIEQREGRIIRYGNENKNVRIYRYIQEKSYDSYQWQMQERKASFINQALSGGTVSELEEMSDFQLSAREAKAIASGNPLLLEKIEVEDKLNNLKSLRNKFNTDKLEMQDRLSALPNRIAQKERSVSNITADVKTVSENATKDFEITLGKTKYTERAKAAEALKKGIANAPHNGTRVKIGSYRGLDLYYSSSFDMGTHYILKGNGEYSTLGGDSTSGNITRIVNLAEKIGETLEADKALIDNYKAEIETLKKEVGAEFSKAQELEELQSKLNDIDTQLGINVSTVDMSEVIVDDEADSGSDTIHSSKDIAVDDSASRWTAERAENGKKSKGTVNISEIVKSISDKFGIPIASGKVTDREASAIYKDKPETIRTRIANNLPAISHELGHHLNKMYALDELGSIEELRNAVSEDFLNQYPENEKDAEAVSEFVRIYLKNTNEANRLCSDFYSDFVNTLSKADLKSLNEIASSVNEYMSYDISERYKAAIVSSKEAEKLSLRDMRRIFYTKWVDKYYPVKQAVDYVEEATEKSLSGSNNAYMLATNSLNAHNIANFLISEGFRDFHGNVLNKKSFMDCISIVKPKHIKLLDEYLMLRHSLEWIAPQEEDVTKKRVYADDTLENVEEIKKQIAEIEKAHPEIKTAAENLYEYQNNILEYFVVQAGGMTEDMMNNFKRMYPSYVPFYRAKGKKLFGKGTFANQRLPFKKAKGSGELILSPLENIMRNTEKFVKYALYNQTMQELGYYADNVDGFGQYMEKIVPDMSPHTINISKLKESFEDALMNAVHSSEDYDTVTNIFEELFGNTVTDFTPVANASKRIVTVMRDGKPSYYQIHDEELYKAVAELPPQQLTGLLRISHAIMQPMKILITQNNPVFAVGNAIRDIGTVYKLSEINNPAVFAFKYIQATAEIITNSDAYKQYKAMGGGHSSELSANIENISKTLREVAHKDMRKAIKLGYSIFRHPVESVAHLNDIVESIPRFMEFQRTLESGGDLQQAIYNADDISTNFKKSGSGATAKGINNIIMYNNAAIQGLDKLFRTLTDKDPKKRRATWLKFIMHALLMGAIGWLWNKEVDEEGYKNLSSYRKNNYYNFAIGDGKFISLPKPRENALLDTFTERTIEYFIGENEEAFYNFSNYLGLQLLPPMLPDTLNPVDALHSVAGSTIIGGLSDVGFNKDFRGMPIEGKYESDLPSNERYNESTTKLAYNLGQTKIARDLDMSPKKIDHLISSYTGILGQGNKALFPMNENRKDKSIGLRNKFISDSNYSTDVLNKMYENKEKAEKAFNYKKTAENAVEYEKNAVITSYISEMNKAVKALPDDEQRNGRAYLLKSLNNRNYGDTTEQANMLNRLESQPVNKDIIFDKLPSSTLEWTEKKQKYVYQMTPQEYSDYTDKYLTAVENARKRYGKNTAESYENAKKAVKEYMAKYKNTVLKKQYGKKATKAGE